MSLVRFQDGPMMEKEVSKIRDLLTTVEDSTLGTVTNTEPAQRDRAEDAVFVAYREAGLPAPGRFQWFPSPWECSTYLSTEMAGESHGDLIGQIWSLPRAKAWTAIRAHIGCDESHGTWNILVEGPSGRL